MEIGKKEYGHEVDVFDGRDWEREALEEILDACVYIAERLIEIDSVKTYQWWKDEIPLGKKEEKVVDSDSARIERLIPKDPMAIIKRAGEKLRKELNGDEDE